MYVPSLDNLPETLRNEINIANKEGTLCPDIKDIFKAFNSFPLTDTRVVILGQDPYHTKGKASGLAFGYHYNYTGKIDSSLYNILDEVERDTGLIQDDLTLQSWAEQGVLLLNTRLTTVLNKPLGHAGLGWEYEIGYFLERLGDSVPPHVYLLWGKEAQGYKKYINSDYNLVLETSHPSVFSAHLGFKGCSHFTKANNFLIDNNREGVIWGREDLKIA